MTTRREIFQSSRVLVVGHGPSYKDYDFIKNFKGLILSVDASTGDLIYNGIIPDYTLYSETQHTVRHNLHKYLPDECAKSKMKAVYREKICPSLPSKLFTLHLDSYEFNTLVETVGLYAIAFADYIQAEEIHLIGYDYRGLDNDGVDQTLYWKEIATEFLKTRKGGVIIDHSKGDFPL